MYQVLARKWRPHAFADVIGQSYTVRALSQALKQGYLHHGYVFSGMRGVGKTTIARLLAQCLNCEEKITPTPCEQCTACTEMMSGCFPDLYEVDAASRTQVEYTRELLDSVAYAPLKGRFKIYLIDEIHMLSVHSFNALLKTLEEPPAHVKFLLATTIPQKIPTTVLSRCLHFRLLAISAEQITEHCAMILDKEGCAFDRTALALLAEAASGSMRDALSLLEQCVAHGNGQVRLTDVQAMLGTVDAAVLFDILEALSLRDGHRLLGEVDRLSNLGIDFSYVLGELLSCLHRITVMQLVPERRSLNADDMRLLQLSQVITPEDVQIFYQIVQMGQRDLHQSSLLAPRMHFEITLLRMLAFYVEDQAVSSTSTQAVSVNPSREEPKAPKREPSNQRPKHIEPPKDGDKTLGKIPTTSFSSAPSVLVDGPSVEAEPSDNTTDLAWPDIIPNLHLSGAALLLAQQCCLESVAGSAVKFQMSAKQKPLLQARQVHKIEAALSKYFGQPWTVVITLHSQNHVMPAPASVPTAISDKGQADHQPYSYEELALSDPNIQEIIRTFDATVLKESIKPIAPEPADKI